MPSLATRQPTSRHPGGLARAARHVIWCRACFGQYPGEKEVTFPPYTCLESDGDARLERQAKGGEVIIFPLTVAPPPAPPLPKTLVAALSRRAAAARSSCGHELRLWQGGSGRLQLAAGNRASPSEVAAAGDADASQGGVRAQARACARGAAFAGACARCVRMRARMGAPRGASASCRACRGVRGAWVGVNSVGGGAGRRR